MKAKTKPATALTLQLEHIPQGIQAILVSNRSFKDPAGYSAENDQDMMWAVDWMENREPTEGIGLTKANMPPHSHIQYVKPSSSDNPLQLTHTDSNGNEHTMEGPWCLVMEAVNWEDMSLLVKAFFGDFMGIGKPQKDGGFSWNGNKTSKYITQKNPYPQQTKSWTTHFTIQVELIGVVRVEVLHCLQCLFKHFPFLNWSGKYACNPSHGKLDDVFLCECRDEEQVRLRVEEFEQARTLAKGFEAVHKAPEQESTAVAEKLPEGSIATPPKMNSGVSEASATVPEALKEETISTLQEASIDATPNRRLKRLANTFTPPTVENWAGKRHCFKHVSAFKKVEDGTLNKDTIDTEKRKVVHMENEEKRNPLETQDSSLHKGAGANEHGKEVHMESKKKRNPLDAQVNCGADVKELSTSNPPAVSPPPTADWETRFTVMEDKTKKMFEMMQTLVIPAFTQVAPPNSADGRLLVRASNPCSRTPSTASR